MKIFAKWLLSAAALLAVAHLYSGVEVKSFSAALIASLVIGLFNAILRPVLVVLTLPVTLLTLGLFLFGRRHFGRLSCAGLWRRADRLADLLGSVHRDRFSAQPPVL
jgi:predicted ABC-type sugar transport system permease subunit